MTACRPYLLPLTQCNPQTHRLTLLPQLVALPVDIHSPNATYGTQFGLIERPTHRNTTLDQAKFEVCAHRFGDLSETGYGVSY
jgi:hypothetical protein